MPHSPSSIGTYVADARHARFVGRADELARLREALTADTLPFHVALIYGPGGIGKTTLLDEVARLAEAEGRAVVRIDGRDVEATPLAFEDAVERAGLKRETSDRQALLIDTFERIDSLDGWLRRSFVPSLGPADIVVIAGRGRPSPEWRAGWAGEAVVLPLRNLARSEAVAYLAARGVPEAAHERVQAFTHGHPLALTLVAERVRQSGEEVAFDPADAPDLLADLLARFASEVPSAAHRAALEGAAVVQAVTVPLLEALLDGASGDGAPSALDTEALFAWLRGLGFSETDAHGVRLHDVVRETVEADLRWRDPDRHDAIHARARHFYADRLRGAATDARRRRTLADYLHLYRHHAVVRPLLGRLQDAWAEADLAGASPLRDSDHARLTDAVARHQSPAEAEHVAQWLRRRPEAVEVFRTRTGEPAGFLLTLALDALDAEAREADPVTAAAWAGGARCREGERALLFRSWLDVEAGQGVSAVQSLVFERTVERYLTTPALATSILLTSEPDLWEMVFSFVGLQRWTAAEAPDGPAAFGKDWRAMPPDVWLAALAAQSPTGPVVPAFDRVDTLVVLGEEAFAEAVREALKAYARPHSLAENPLLRARFVHDARAKEEPAADTLLRLIAEAAQQLNEGTRERRYYRALDLTYLRPTPTQALAAERLSLPFSTYRRHLRRGVDHVVEALWRLETGG